MGSSTISLGLGLGGGKASTSSGRPGGGGSFDPSTMSASFDGTNDFLTIGTSAIALDTNFTISAWIKGDHFGGSGYKIIGGWGENAAGKLRALQIRSGVSFELYGSRIIGSTTLVPGMWYHVAATLSGNDVKVYLNGSQDGSGTLSRSSFSTSTTYIGGETALTADGFNPFDGLIDEFSAFDSVLTASQITSIYNSGVPADLTSYSPVGWWRMGENDSGSNGATIGTVTDQGSGGNNATGTNGPTYSTDVPVAFTNEYSVDFDGTDDYLNIPHDSSLTISGDLTISAWVNRAELVNASAGGYLPILSKRPATHTSTNYQFYLDSADGSAAGGLRFYNGSAATSPASGTVITAGSWFHVAISVESGVTNGTKWYVNGVAESNSSTITIDKTNTDAVFVGRLGAGFSYYGKGLIDEVALFDSALSAPQIASIYNSGRPADISALSPLGWWRMGDGTEAGSGTTIYDMSSNSNNGTLANGPTYSSDTP